MVEVNASDSGIGVVLSQSKGDKLHPCTHLSLAKRNYEIGDREMLAIKLALEKWRHWLEGTIQPFIVWTDQKTLEYLHSPKQLNSWQARWACQEFTRFNFSITYRPGTCNVKPDALS